LAVGGGKKGFTGANLRSVPGYHIDENTFQDSVAPANYKGGAFSWTFQPITNVSETTGLFSGLCLKCHPRTDIQTSQTATWKSRDRVHNTVKGWARTATTDSNVNNNIHAYTCSKCHAPHNSNQNRLMVTNCLDVKHRGRVISTGTASVQQKIGNSGRGNGRFPVGGGGFANSSSGKNWNSPTGGAWYFGIAGTTSTAYSGFRQCHDSHTPDGTTETWPAYELWNTRSPW
jgi:hypothetical protein